MKKLLILLLIIIFIQGCSQQNSTEETNNNLEISNIKEGGINMKIISNNFNNNGDIPSKFTCQDKNIRPHLKWSDFPKETKSFAISVIDPDAPSGNFVHWLIYDIPNSVTELKEGLEIPIGSIEVSNDAGKKQFIGPCPPSGKHRYFFTIYALNVEKLNNINPDNFIEKAKANSIASAEIIGLYQKK